MADFKHYIQITGVETLVDLHEIEYVTNESNNTCALHLKSGATIQINAPFKDIVQNLKRILLNEERKRKV